MKKNVISILFLTCVFFANAQKILVTSNIGLDETSADKKEIIKLWNDYLNSKPDSLYNNPYWNDVDKLKLKSYDLLKSEAFVSPSLYAYGLQNTILSITNLGNKYLLKTMFFGYVDRPIKDTISVWAITNHLVKKENGVFKLYNYQPYYTANWLQQTIGKITYIYYPEYQFDIKKVKEANEFLNKIEKNFKFQIPQITYFIAKNCDEIFKVKGFDYVLSMGNQCECGFFDAYNNIVYTTAKGGENHQHELIHLVNRNFPNGNSYLLAGLAAYFGGEHAQNGKSLFYHINKFYIHLKQHPELDLNNFSMITYWDIETEPLYVFGALICDRAYKEGGIEKLKKCINCGKEDEDMYRMIETELKIPKNKLNEYLRKTIEEIVKKGEFNVELK